MRNNRLKELGEEFRTVFSGRGNWIDSLLPPLLFLIGNSLAGFELAIGLALAISILITGYRLYRGQALRYAFGGFAAVALAALLARLIGRAEGFFIPNLVQGGITVLIALGSILIRRPMVAWTSFLTRRWPWNWYWHPKVRPAYSEVTWMWTLYFGLRLLVQVRLFQNEATNLLAITNVIAGWPGILVLLVISYLYGVWRLGNLQGPSVEEFTADQPPPWEGQKRGF
jgi:hypothetical protein